MRWDNLFDDLESQLESELSADELGLEVEEERLRLARLGMRDRIIALQGAGASIGPLRVVLSNGDRISVSPESFGRDWFAGPFSDRGGQCIVPIGSIAALIFDGGQLRASLAPSIAGEQSSLGDRLGLPFVLRDLCRRRRSVAIALADSTVHGTIDRVGRDHVDVALHEPGSARRESAVREFRLVPLAAIVMVVL